MVELLDDLKVSLVNTILTVIIPSVFCIQFDRAASRNCHAFAMLATFNEGQR